MNLDLKYYLSIFLRRIHWFIIFTAIGASAGITVAMILPPEYEARAQLLIEQAQIPTELAASTVRTPGRQQLRILRERLMARQNLLDLANRLDMYAEERAAGEPLSAGQIVGDLRTRSRIEQVRNSPFVVVSFTDEDPNLAATVANEFVTLILQENVALRTEQAGDTLEFFEQEVERLGAELDRMSVRLIQFQNEAGIAVPGNLDFLRGRLRDMQDRIETREREIDTLTEQKVRITELYESGNLIASEESLSPLERQLRAAERELSDAQLVFSATNPRLNFLRARVEQLEAQVEAELIAASEAADPNAVSPQDALFREQTQDIDERMGEAEEEIAELRAEIEVFERHVTAAPSNGVELDKLDRDFNNVQQQYNAAVQRLSAAATGERIEVLAKGQRISVIEQATRPNRPSQPNRPIIAAMGTGAGVAAGFGLILLLELLNRSIRRPVELTNRLGISPIGVLPYMKTEREVALKRLTLVMIGLFLLLIVPLGLYTVHTVYQPLDQLIEPYLNRIGYSLAG